MSVYYGGAENSTTTVYPNQGIRTTVNCVAQNFSESLLAAWVAEAQLSSSVIGGNTIWAQIGYDTESGNINNFVQIWNLTTETIVGGLGGATVTPGSHQFAMNLWTSGTVWQFFMDGGLIGNFDLGVSSMGNYGGQPLEVLVEEQNGNVSFSNVEFTTCMEVLLNGVWTSVGSAYAYQTGEYGVQGAIQNSALANNQIIVGKSISTIPNNTILWPFINNTSTKLIIVELNG